MPPRLAHKKSKTGCQRCKNRKVKCDEQHPVCGSCQRHGVECVYAPTTTTQYAHSTTSQDTSLRRTSTVGTASQGILNLKGLGLELDESLERILPGMTIPEPDLTVTETYNRRIIELRLLHHWTMNTSFTMPGVQIPEVQRIWHTGMVSLALSYPFLLHAIFSLAALHIIRYPDPESPLSIDIYRHYLIAAVNGHRFTLGSLEALSQVDAVHLTSLIISIHLIAELNSGSSGPYKPPTQWLNMATRAGAATNMVCIRKANIQSTFTWATFPPSPHSISRAEVLNRDNISNVGLYNVMERWQGDGDEFPFQETTKAAYEDALAFIGWIELDIRRGLSIHETARRLLAFGHYIIPLFAELVEKGRPRALVILASFFSCFATLGSIWWCEGVANQEVMGIWNILPDNCWKTKMAWAIEKLNLEKEQNYIFENLVSRPSAQGLA